MMRNQSAKWTSVVVTALASTVLYTGIASAHVVVVPSTSNTGAWEKYTAKVPDERNKPTGKVTLKIPSGLEFEQYEPVPGWAFSLEKDSSGHTTTITWTTTADGILPGQFQEFNFVAKNPKTASKAAWDAFQYYKDGTIVEWTGAEGSKTPHSFTVISNAPTAKPSNQITDTSTSPASPTSMPNATQTNDTI